MKRCYLIHYMIDHSFKIKPEDEENGKEYLNYFYSLMTMKIIFFSVGLMRQT